jgi:hypothetical protein
MASEWIKMRAELLTHPRFIKLAHELIHNDDEVGLLVYACGARILQPLQDSNDRNETVTERALRCVTVSALHDVTLARLMTVWCAVNAHGKVRDNDATLEPMTVLELDRIAGVAGFGLAMEASGWVREERHNVLVFPNFLEFNEPACLRAKPKTNAERQAEFRARKKSCSDVGNGCVTKVTKSNAREEKRREEKKEEIHTLAPLDSSDEEFEDVPLDGYPTPATPKPASEYSGDFENFWSAYPRVRRNGKGHAWKAWKAALKVCDPITIIEAAREYGESPVGSGEFSKQPATWLNGRCWEDDRQSWSGKTAPKCRVPSAESLANWNPYN